VLWSLKHTHDEGKVESKSNQRTQRVIVSSDGFSSSPLILPCEKFLRTFTSGAARELARVDLGNAIDGLDTAGEDSLWNLAVGDVLGDESGGLLLRDDEGEVQLSVELMEDADGTHLRNG